MLLMHCDDTAYIGTPDTILYKLVDAICGTTGAGGLVNEIFLARAAGALETIYYNDLDYIFSKVNFLARSPAESYPYNPLVDTLTADQWNEVRTKDAWYRARVKDFFVACSLGTTLPGIRMCVQAALGVDADVFEVWRYMDNFGITEAIGRAPVNARNELVVRPHKTALLPVEFRLARDMLDKMSGLDTIITVDVDGLAVHTPVSATSAASDSEYFEVQKVVTPTPLMSQLPPPDLLPIDLQSTEQWMFSKDPVLAPYAAFNITQEYSYFYLAGGGKRSPIDSVTYGIINAPVASKIAVFELFGTYTVGGQTSTFPPQSFVASALSPDLFEYHAVTFQADLYPMSDAILAGVASLVSAIDGCSGSFALVGADMGAIIASYVYDEIRTGSLANRLNQFLGAAVFGNARRGPGRAFPGWVYPHGHGVHVEELLVGTGDSWWEFVVPGDIIADNDHDHGHPDDWHAQLFGTLYPNYSGNISAITSLVAPPVPVATQLMQNLIDAIYGDRPTNPHNQYFTYQPLLSKGDYRTCAQIAADYIASMAVPRATEILTGAGGSPVTVYEVGGTELTSAADSWFATNLDSRIRYVWTSWSPDDQPLEPAIATGVNNLLTQINRNPGKFMMIGRGAACAIVSAVYQQLQSGGLQHRTDDLLAVVTFGSTVREAGHTFPGGTDPGGHGISATLMSGTPSLWWDFADSADTLTVETNDTNGTWMTTAFEAVLSTYAGDLSVVTAAYPDAPVNISLMATNIINILFHGGQQVDYSTTTPLSGDARTSFEIARDYLNTFASQAVPYVSPPTDPMGTYQPEANFESFTNTAQYGPWQTYEIVDSPDNYPGGKFGRHRQSAPALNPDGTPYQFPWASQAAYVAFKSQLVISMGGQADTVRFRLPISNSATSKEVFLPEYSIAYSAPAMDSTVSKSLTARRPKTVNQRGSNWFFPRVNV